MVIVTLQMRKRRLREFKITCQVLTPRCKWLCWNWSPPLYSCPKESVFASPHSLAPFISIMKQNGLVVGGFSACFIFILFWLWAIRKMKSSLTEIRKERNQSLLLNIFNLRSLQDTQVEILSGYLNTEVGKSRHRVVSMWNRVYSYIFVSFLIIVLFVCIT